MTQAQRQRFERAQAAYRAADAKLFDLELELHRKYGNQPQDSWLSAAHRKKRVQLRAARDRAGDRVSAALEGAPRDWFQGVPAHWVRSELSVEDAFRPLSEPLSVTPPKAWGYADNPANNALVVGGVVALGLLAWIFCPKKAEAKPMACASAYDVKSFGGWKGLYVIVLDGLPSSSDVPPSGYDTLLGRVYSTVDCNFYRYWAHVGEMSKWHVDAPLNAEFAKWRAA